MKKCKFIISLALLVVLLVPRVYATRVYGLYRVRVPVTSSASINQPEIWQTALAQALVKVSGNSSIATIASIQQALSKARNYVVSYSYDAQILTVQFSKPAIINLLRQTQQPIWGEDRPLLLVWLATVDASGNYALVNSDAALAKSWQQQTTQRGLPTLLPLLDMQDLSAVNNQVLASVDVNAMTQAAKRYNAKDIVIGEIKQEVNNTWSAKWTLIIGQDINSWQVTGPTQDSIVAAGVAKIADQLAANLAVVSNSNLNQQLTIAVSNVVGLDTYAKVLSYLQSLNVVSQVELRKVTPNGIELNLTVEGGNDGLIKALAVDDKMVPLVLDNNKISGAIDAAYRWVSP